jgi:hypothetical protein
MKYSIGTESATFPFVLRLEILAMTIIMPPGHMSSTTVTFSAHAVPHRHYRLVLDTIGRPLHAFKDSRELVRAVYHALDGQFALASRLAL